jgi:hypothetical protein
MKKITLILTSLYFTGCFTMFEREETLMAQLMLKNNSLINVIDAGTGATSPDIIWIEKINENGKKISIDSIQHSGHLYKASVEQINDTMINITLTDTVLFIGKKISKLVNLNNKLELHHP